MANFAKIENGVVVQVVVVHNNELLVNGVESEQAGVSFLKNIFGQDTVWVQTSFNGNMRKNFAGVGFIYDPTRDAFIPQQPYPSWTLNESTCRWDAPTPAPTFGGNPYLWDEATLSWVEVEMNPNPTPVEHL
jgi:hypothetical protein